MKSPDQLRARLRRQWFDGTTREHRLLDHSAWPLRLAIGKPTPSEMTTELPAVRAHLDAWRAQHIGSVEYAPIRYRSTADAVELPHTWRLDNPDQWIAATGDDALRAEYRLLRQVLDATDQSFHRLLIRQRQMLLARSADEIILGGTVAMAVAPGCADGRPLRALSVAGCDSKFFERNRALMTRLLSLRFGEDALDGGLEAFLGASDDAEHWLLIAALDPSLLPFQQLRARADELRRTPLPGNHLIIVENERSLYQLPALPDTIAILGAGLNLSWLNAPWLAERRIAYWGDLDTWGLTMLASARRLQPALTAALMDATTFTANAANAVQEPVPAEPEPPTTLTASEQALYRDLRARPQGRLEQEFLAPETVREALTAWHGNTAE